MQNSIKRQVRDEMTERARSVLASYEEQISIDQQRADELQKSIDEFNEAHPESQQRYKELSELRQHIRENQERIEAFNHSHLKVRIKEPACSA